jgi:hypothetical protein
VSLLIQLLETPYQLEPPINCLIRTEIQEIFNNLNHQRSTELYLITSKTGIHHVTQLLNAVLLKGYLPAQWKVAQIIPIPKPGKTHSSHELTSYPPISLLLIIFKILEKFKRAAPNSTKIN